MRLPCPSPGDLPDPGIEPGSPTLRADTLPSEPPGKRDLQKHSRECIHGIFIREHRCYPNVILGLSATQTPAVNSGRLQRLSCECLKHTSSVSFCTSLLTAFQALTWLCIHGSMWSRPMGATAIQNFSSVASLGHGCPIAPCLRARRSQGWDGSPRLQFPPYSGPVCGQSFMIL